MTRVKIISLFVALNIPFVILFFVWQQGLRLSVILLSFVAMWSLWVARRERKHLWTPKMRDIWLVLFCWCLAAAEGNIELFYRHARTSVAIILVVNILVLTIKGVFNGERYTIDQP
jgi:hypothetical protein